MGTHSLESGIIGKLVEGTSIFLGFQICYSRIREYNKKKTFFLLMQKIQHNFY
jgi:hypothetical protein